MAGVAFASRGAPLAARVVSPSEMREARVTVQGMVGSNCVVQYAESLSGTNNWRFLTNVVLSSGSYEVVDAHPAATKQRFYRVVRPEFVTASAPATNPTFKVWGDSISVGIGAATCFGAQVAARNNWAFENHAVGGTFSILGSASVYSETTSKLCRYVIGFGYNEMAHYPRGTQITNCTDSCVLAEAAWLAIPDEKKVRQGHRWMTTSGVWTNAPAYAFGIKSSGDNASITITNLAGRTIVVGMAHWEKGSPESAYRVAVDGATVLTNSAISVDVISQPGWGCGAAPFGILLTNLSDTVHTLTITALRGSIEFDWCAADFGALAAENRPKVYLTPTTIRSTAAIYPLWHQDPADTATFDQKLLRCNNVYRRNAAKLAAVGLNVSWIDFSCNFDPGVDLSADGIHPSTSGQIKLSYVFEAGMNRADQRTAATMAMSQ